MFAIVDIAGQQFKVEKGKSYFVHRLPNAVGESVPFDKVLLLYNESDIRVGTPLVEGTFVDTKVLEHLKGDKVVVFKKKRRKGYKVKKGHRQCFTKILVEAIVLDGEIPKKKVAKKESVMEQSVEIAPENLVAENIAIETLTVEDTAVETIVVEEASPKKKTPKKAVKENAEPTESATTDEAAPKEKTVSKKPAAKKLAEEEQPTDAEPIV